jgi:hypothetical protein
MTHREARQKLGSRSRRRANTNGKNLGRSTKRGWAIKRRHPRTTKRFVAVQVAKFVKEA